MTNIFKFFLIIFLLLLVFSPLSVLRAYSFIGSSGLDETGEQSGTQEILGNYTDNFPMFIGRIINIALGFLGVIFLGLSIYGGFIWMMAKGDSAQIEKAQNIIKNSIIGLVIVVAAYAITNFVYSAFFSL
jgi:hypothetical protein